MEHCQTSDVTPFTHLANWYVNSQAGGDWNSELEHEYSVIMAYHQMYTRAAHSAPILSSYPLCRPYGDHATTSFGKECVNLARARSGREPKYPDAVTFDISKMKELGYEHKYDL